MNRAVLLAFSLAAALVPVEANGQTTKRPAPWRELQGFNIVLVVGENERSGGSSMELPGGARRALTDMREFLPYRHYRVLDSQWTSCCSHETARGGMVISGRLQGLAATTSVRAGARGTNVESGVAPRTYAFTLWLMDSPDGTRLPVKFTLRDDGFPRASGQGGSVGRDPRTSELRTELEVLQVQIEAARRRVAAGTLHSDELRTLEARYAGLQRQIAEAAGSGGSASAQPAHRAVLDTSFMMDPGETIVVGTSRLGGDKALIALVTAVRRSGSSR